MRRHLPFVLLLAAIVGFAPAHAQDKQDKAPVPDGAEATAGCVFVEEPGDVASRLACLQQRLRTAARRAQRLAQPPAAPLDARSTDTRVGLANEAATRQRMGNQFGVGVHPQRPPAPVYSPAVPRR